MKTTIKNPPRVATWLFKRMRQYQEHYSISGDVEEVYSYIFVKKGYTKAALWYWYQCIISGIGYIYHKLYWSLTMVRNNLKTALRNIQKHRGYAIINITGLAMGMACCMLILLWVRHELSYDTFHEKGNRIFRVIQHIQYSEVVHWAINQGPLAPALKEEIPEIIEAARYKNAGWRMKVDGVYYVRYGAYVDPSFLKMFDFPLAKGDPLTALSNPHSVLITEELGETLFGVENPIGKTIMLRNEIVIEVTGVLKNIPDNSHLAFDFLGTMEFAKEIGYTVDIWTNSTFNTYVLLADNVTQEQVEAKMYNFLDDKPTLEDWEKLTLQPLSAIHLDTSLGYENAITTNIRYIIIFFAAALFILIIACINFVNLSTALSSLREKEVGMRKVVGAFRTQLIRQFFSESTLLVFIAFILAVALIALLLPKFNDLSGKHFTMDVLLTPVIIFGAFIIVLFTGIASGGYPAITLSSLRPIQILRGTTNVKNTTSSFRKVLVVFQLVISVFLMTGTLVVYYQIRHMQNQDIGYNRDNLLYILVRGNAQQQHESFKQALRDNPQILAGGASASFTTRGITFTNARWQWQDKDPDRDLMFRATFIDEGFIDAFDIKMVEGRSFSREFLSDSSGLIFNDAAVQAMGMGNPVGHTINYVYNSATPFHCIGVARDFNFQSLHSKIEPLILLRAGGIFGYPYPSFIYVRMSGENITETISFIEKTWKSFESEYEFSYGFIDEEFRQLYVAESRIGNVIRAFTLLAVFISCLGLFGLASFMVMRRTKEIGIRKVLGAPESGILALMLKEFTKWVVVANVIAWPISYFAMRNWLSLFAYHINPGAWIFLCAGVASLVVALLTVMYHTVRAVRAKPVDSLRYE